MKEKIQELFSRAKLLMKENNFNEARKIIEVILLLDPSNEEALYVISKFNDENLMQQNKLVKSEIKNTNLYIDNNLWGGYVTTSFFINGTELTRIRDKGTAEFVLQPGKYNLFIRCSPYGQYETTFEILNDETNVRIRTFYKFIKMKVEVIID